MHHAYSKNAEVTVPSLDDWEKQWNRKTQGSDQKSVISDQNGMPKPAVLPVDFKAPQTGLGAVAREMAVAAVAQGA